MKKLRIGLVGAAGTGKSSIAEGVVIRLQKKMGIRLVESKAITKEILDRDGYDYGSGVQVERFLANGSRQLEILERLTASQVAHGGNDCFVADRTFIDLASYAVVELHDDDTSLLRKIFYACKGLSPIYTHLFLCPWKDKPISDNHRRTLNPWYQFQIHALDKGIMADWGLKYDVLKSEGTDKRVKEIVDAVLKA